MKSLVAFAALSAAAAIAAPASAQSSPTQTLQSYLAPVSYNASLGYTGIAWAGNNLGAVTLRAGADFGKYLGVEGEGSFGVSDAAVSLGGASAKTHLNNAYAGYVVGRYPIMPNGNLFARVQVAVAAAHEQVGALQHRIVRHDVGGVLVVDVFVHGHAADLGALVDETNGAFALDPEVLTEVGPGAQRQQAEVLATDIDAGVADAGAVGRLAHERQVLSESRRRQGADRRDGGESNERLHCVLFLVRTFR